MLGNISAIQCSGVARRGVASVVVQLVSCSKKKWQTRQAKEGSKQSTFFLLFGHTLVVMQSNNNDMKSRRIGARAATQGYLCQVWKVFHVMKLNYCNDISIKFIYTEKAKEIEKKNRLFWRYLSLGHLKFFCSIRMTKCCPSTLILTNQWIKWTSRIWCHCSLQCKLVVNIKKWVDINEYMYVCIKLVHACWENWQYALWQCTAVGCTSFLSGCFNRL